MSPNPSTIGRQCNITRYNHMSHISVWRAMTLNISLWILLHQDLSRKQASISNTSIWDSEGYKRISVKDYVPFCPSFTSNDQPAIKCTKREYSEFFSSSDTLHLLGQIELPSIKVSHRNQLSIIVTLKHLDWVIDAGLPQIALLQASRWPISFHYVLSLGVANTFSVWMFHGNWSPHSSFWGYNAFFLAIWKLSKDESFVVMSCRKYQICLCWDSVQFLHHWCLPLCVLQKGGEVLEGVVISVKS